MKELKEDHVPEPSDRRLPRTLQSFLSRVGVLAAASTTDETNVVENFAALGGRNYGNDIPRSSVDVIDEESIFESSLDLTPERLRYVFDMFDTDKDGQVTYDSLRRGLDLHSSGRNSIDDETFAHFTEHIDSNGDGNISFEEFSEGIRILMLRALFGGQALEAISISDESFSSCKVSTCSYSLDVLDYDSMNCQRRQILSDRAEKASSDASQRQPGRGLHPHQAAEEPVVSMEDFFFHKRPEWVKARWIHVIDDTQCQESRADASLTLKRLAIKYLLHPLALEDALMASDTVRPKADVYSNHYFIMAPIFYLDYERFEDINERRRASGSWWNACCHRLKLSCCCNTSSKDQQKKAGPGHQKKQSPVPHGQRVKAVKAEMMSIFVNIPDNDTMITTFSGCSDGSSSNNNDRNTNNTMNPSSHVFESTQFSGKMKYPGDEEDPGAVDNANLVGGRKQNHAAVIGRVQAELERSYSKLRQYDAHYLTYALLDAAVDLLDPLVTRMRFEILREKEILEKTRYRDMSRIYHLKRELEKVNRKLKPFLRLLSHVIEDDAISPGATVYIKDVYDNLECSDDEVRQLIAEAEAIDSDSDKFQSKQMDRTLYTLTVVSAVFLPAQFLTGVWGMNFQYMPELDETWGYPMFWILSAVMMTSLIVALNFGRTR